MTVGVAAFDFDGTITHRDTLAPFLWTFGRRTLVSSALRSLSSVRNREGARDLVKERVIRSLFEGIPAADLEDAGLRYASNIADRYQPRTLGHIQRHAAYGHMLVLVTASLGVYARPAGAALGFDHVIAVELEADQAGILTGEMTGPNVRGPEKERRLRSLLEAEAGDGEVELWAYGNSNGDSAMLSMADHPTWVGRRE